MGSYKYKTEPYEHQIEALKLSWNKKIFAYFMEMGTGKTKVTLDNAGALYEQGVINGLIVMAPKGAYMNWLDEVDIHLPDRIPRNLIHWTTVGGKYHRNKVEAVVGRLGAGLDIFIVNIEAMSGGRGIDVAERFLKNHRSMLVVDESTTIKNKDANRTKKLIEMGKNVEFKRILSGFPVVQSPLDLYTQTEFLLEGLLGYKSYYAYRNHVCIMQKQRMGPKSFDVIVGYKSHNIEQLAQAIKTFSYRAKKSECLDLPPKIYQRYEVAMTDTQAKVYKDMRDKAIVAFEDGDATVTSVIAAIIRLQQILCGYLPLDDGTIQEIPTNKYSALFHLLGECQGKVVIWATFRKNIQEILATLQKTYGEETAEAYYGDTSGADRPVINARFQDPVDPLRFLVVNKTGARGINLFASSEVIYFNNSYDLDDRMQSEDRCHRIGQTKAVTYTDIFVPRTIDQSIVTSLRDKKAIAQMIVDSGHIDEFI